MFKTLLNYIIFDSNYTSFVKKKRFIISLILSITNIIDQGLSCLRMRAIASFKNNTLVGWLVRRRLVYENNVFYKQRE